MDENWRDEVSKLVELARKALERSMRTTSRQIAERRQREAIYLLMEAVEVHNDNFRFKCTPDGQLREDLNG